MLKPTQAKSINDYIRQIDEPRRSEIKELHTLIKKTVPKMKPHLLEGMKTLMIGYGKYQYQYASGRKGEWSVIALASQKQYISVYIMAATKDGQYVAEKNRKLLPKASIGKSCIRFKKLGDIDQKQLQKIIREGVKEMERDIASRK